jgi:hypothetical protein
MGTVVQIVLYARVIGLHQKWQTIRVSLRRILSNPCLCEYPDPSFTVDCVT